MNKKNKKKLISETTYRSKSMVNMSDDMVRVEIDMPLTVWWGWKRKMFSEDPSKETTPTT